MPMPNRNIQDANGYRYAYQGQEKDPETGKEAFELRLWDGRIGRWLTTDPAHQYHSPYLGMGNDPVNGVDADGAYVIFPTRAQAIRAAKNINALLRAKLGLKVDAISISELNYSVMKPRYFFFEKEYNYNGFSLDFDNSIDLSSLDPTSRFIIESFKDLTNSKDAKILGAISDPSDSSAEGLSNLGNTKGYTYTSRFFKVPSNLPDFDNKIQTVNIASQILHESLWHIGQLGNAYIKAGLSAESFYRHLGVTSLPGGIQGHGTGSRQNQYINPRTFEPYD